MIYDEIEKEPECVNWKMQALKRAKLEAKKGEFISHEAMCQWVNSLETERELPAPSVDVYKRTSITRGAFRN